MRFLPAVMLIALGYATVYYGASMAKAYRAVHGDDLDPDTKGGIPFPVLLGISKGSTERQAMPPFVTGTSTHRPKGDPK